MGLHEKMLDLESSLRSLSQGVNALGLMSMGLDQAMDPYADGFNALLVYMEEVDRNIRRQWNDCLESI